MEGGIAISQSDRSEGSRGLTLASDWLIVSQSDCPEAVSHREGARSAIGVGAGGGMSRRRLESG